jgi:hypothetical protein
LDTFKKKEKNIMAVTIIENPTIMGQPKYRFEIRYSVTDEVEYFDQGWKQAVRAYQLFKQGVGIFCKEWDKKANEWVYTTDETIEEGRARAERSRNGNKEMEPKEIVPSLSDDQVSCIKDASATLKIVAQFGKKQLPDHDTQNMIGMELINVLVAVGYDIDGIKHLVNQYIESSKAQQ